MTNTVTAEELFAFHEALNDPDTRLDKLSLIKHPSLLKLWLDKWIIDLDIMLSFDGITKRYLFENNVLDCSIVERYAEHHELKIKDIINEPQLITMWLMKYPGDYSLFNSTEIESCYPYIRGYSENKWFSRIDTNNRIMSVWDDELKKLMGFLEHNKVLFPIYNKPLYKHIGAASDSPFVSALYNNDSYIIRIREYTTTPSVYYHVIVSDMITGETTVYEFEKREYILETMLKKCA